MINIIDKIDTIDSYFKFMWNRWTPEENKRFCKFMQKEYLEDHLWNKWFQCTVNAGSIGAPAMLWSLLSNNIQAELVEYIIYRNTNG